MKPYKFAPYLRTMIWGGYQIAPFKSIYTAQPNIGESWEKSAVPGHESVAVEAFEAKYGHKPVIIPVVIGDGSRKI